MLKKTALSIGILFVSLLFVGYWFRLPLTHYWLNKQLAAHEAELSCIDWSLKGDFTLSADKVCLTMQNQRLILRGVRLSRTHLLIEQASLQLSGFESSETTNAPAQLLDLPLPDWRPRFEVKELVIKSAELSQPIRLKLSEPQQNQWSVEGDLSATVNAQTHQLRGHVSIPAAFWSRFRQVPDALSLAQLTFDSKSAFTFTGQQVELKSQLVIHAVQRETDCAISFASQGILTSAYDIYQQRIMLDARQLNNQIELAKSCLAQVQQTLPQGATDISLASSWWVHLPDAIELDLKNFSLPSLNVLARSSAPQQETAKTQLQIELSELNWAPSTLPEARGFSANDWSGQIGVKLTDAQLGIIDLQAQLAAAGLQGELNLNLVKFKLDASRMFEQLSASSQFTATDVFSEFPQLALNTDIKIQAAQFEQLKLNDYQGQLTATLAPQQISQLSLTSQLAKGEYLDYRMQGLSNQLQGRFEWPPEKNNSLTFSFTAQSDLETLTAPDIELNSLELHSLIQQETNLHGEHTLEVTGIKAVLEHNLTAKSHPFSLKVSPQSTSLLMPLAVQVMPDIQLTDGVFSADINGDLVTQTAKFNGAIEQLSVLYQSYYIDHLTTQFTGQFNNGQLHIASTPFNLKTLHAGVALDNIKGHWQYAANQASVADLQADVLGGQVFLDKFKLGPAKQTMQLQLKEIDASQLSTLSGQSGILVDGQISGELPLKMEQNELSLSNGVVYSVGQGQLQITNSTGFEAIKKQQAELEPVLSLLENLDINQLRSQVALNTEGWLTLAVKLEGYNQAQQQAVNFNYNHEENIYTLLRALRLNDEITRKVEQEYVKKGKRHD